MRKFIITISLVLAVLLIVSACGGKANEGASEAVSDSGSGVVKEITINASNFEFDVQEIKVNKGDTVKVTLKNASGNHALKFEGYNKEVKGNKTISFVADKAGEFDFLCSVFCGAGHNEMVGKLIVV
jgi:cytochrome c oxidase subunit 2